MMYHSDAILIKRKKCNSAIFFTQTVLACTLRGNVIIGIIINGIIIIIINVATELR